MAVSRKLQARNPQFDEALADLRELVETVQRTRKLPANVAVRRYSTADVRLIPKPRSFKPSSIGEIRTKLGASQRVFADLIGVSLRLVCHWEQGLREPSPLARRMLETIQRDPKPWIAMIRPIRKKGRAA
jgi:DNA-binding transcriptional regulator YiaG